MSAEAVPHFDGREDMPVPIILHMMNTDDTAMYFASEMHKVPEIDNSVSESLS